MHTKYWLEILKRRDHLEQQSIDGRILSWIFKEIGHGPDSFGEGQRPMLGYCEHCNESCGSPNFGNFLTS